MPDLGKCLDNVNFTLSTLPHWEEESCSGKLAIKYLETSSATQHVSRFENHKLLATKISFPKGVLTASGECSWQWKGAYNLELIWVHASRLTAPTRQDCLCQHLSGHHGHPPWAPVKTAPDTGNGAASRRAGNPSGTWRTLESLLLLWLMIYLLRWRQNVVSGTQRICNSQ